jgi:hypothetical protein
MSSFKKAEIKEQESKIKNSAGRHRGAIFFVLICLRVLGVLRGEALLDSRSLDPGVRRGDELEMS